MKCFAKNFKYFLAVIVSLKYQQMPHAIRFSSLGKSLNIAQASSA
jgi:hypothetical protein